MDIFMSEHQHEATQATIRILVVDDEEKLGRFICMLLEQMGYCASVCLRVDEAKRLITKDFWHLVITDIVLPGENGFDLVNWVKKHHPSLPVVAMTAHSTEAVNHHMSKSGFAAILHKPFSIELFQRVIQQTGLPIFPITTADTFL